MLVRGVPQRIGQVVVVTFAAKEGKLMINNGGVRLDARPVNILRGNSYGKF